MKHLELRLGPQRRIVFPVSLHQVWQISTGEVLIARLEDDRLILQKPTAVLQRTKDRLAALRGQPSLADELIADCRRKAGQETAS